METVDGENTYTYILTHMHTYPYTHIHRYTRHADTYTHTYTHIYCNVVLAVTVSCTFSDECLSKPSMSAYFIVSYTLFFFDIYTTSAWL